LKTAVIILGSILIIAIVYFFFIKKKEQGIAVGTNAQGQPVDASGNIVDIVVKLGEGKLGLQTNQTTT
jgi:hypothetical protein